MFLRPVDLKKNSKKDMSMFQEFKLAVLGDCATQHLCTSIRGYGYEEKLNLNIFDADYNQIFALIMDETSELYEFNPDAVLIVMCTQKLYERFVDTPLNERHNFGTQIVSEIKNYWSLFQSHSDKKIIQFNFAEIDDRVYGNYGLSKPGSFIYQLRKINIELADAVNEYRDVFTVDISYIQNMMGREAFCDNKLYLSAKMPYSPMALVRIAYEVVSVIKAVKSIIKKCVVLDLDNTLWGGVIGDDGLSGIEIGELGVGRAFLEFQQYLKELTKTGIILCVCSKNDLDKAKEPFEQHPEMLLRLDDFAMFVANWEDKASNIRNIADTINLGLDSFVFIDDNPFERDQVKSMIPEICVPDMPVDPAEYTDYLRSLNLFERISSSEADADRTRQYREEAGRVTLKQNYKDYNEYLKSLSMKCIVEPFSEFNFPRIAQLSQRSNQFNLRTIRYTEKDVELRANSDDYVTLTFSLKDKFGDYGLISVVAIKITKKKAFIENWFMSCRVLKRTMEEYIVNTIIQKLKEKGIEEVTGEYIRTPKNNMVSDIYSRMGFKEETPCEFTCNLDEYNENQTFIDL